MGRDFFSSMDAKQTGSVEELREMQPDEEVLYDLAELFKVFGDSTRIKILFALESAEL